MKTDNLIHQLAYKSLELVQDEFDNSVDPYWNPWKPLKRPTHKILIDTGRLRSSNRVTSLQATSFEIENFCEYASYHQYGTERIPQRMILPMNEIPDKWKEKFTEIIVDDLKQDLGGK